MTGLVFEIAIQRGFSIHRKFITLSTTEFAELEIV